MHKHAKPMKENGQNGCQRRWIVDNSPREETSLEIIVTNNTNLWKGKGWHGG